MWLGAIYLVARLPPHAADDVAAVRTLAEEHGVALIPGSACGAPGHIRVCYANLPLEQTREAAARLRRGLQALVDGGARGAELDEDRWVVQSLSAPCSGARRVCANTPVRSFSAA